MNIKNEIQGLSKFTPLELLTEKVEAAVAFLSEEPRAVIPSIILGSDGPVLASLVFTTDRFLCEIHLSRPKTETEFDFVARTLIMNYRVKLWTQEIKVEDVVKARFDIATIDLVHEFVTEFATTLSYAGHQRAEWLESVKRAFPVSLILRDGELAGKVTR